MKKVAIIQSNLPNPRLLKRIEVLENDFLINFIYWDRKVKVKESFTFNKNNILTKIELAAPLGNVRKRLIPLFKFARQALAKLKVYQPDIIHAANLDMLLIAYIYKKFYSRQIKIVYEIGDLPKYTFVKKVNSFKSMLAKSLQKIEKKLTKAVSLLILTSPYFWQDYYVDFFSEKKYLFSPNSPFKKDFKNYRFKTSGPYTIGFIGSVRYTKQLILLIDAVNELDFDLKILIAGSGPAYEEILAYSQAFDFVELSGPYDYKKEIAALYSKVDLIYSVYDGSLDNVKIALPNRLYESIICHLPIIGANNTKLGDFINEKQIGFTVDYDDKEMLKTKLLNLLKSQALINTYQKNCQKIAADYYYENNSKELLEAYKKL